MQKMISGERMLFVVKQYTLTRDVVTCDEAGASGFHLHCRLEQFGINNDRSPVN